LTHDRERPCELVFAVVIRDYGVPSKIRYKVAKRLAKLVNLNFTGAEVHIGSRNGNVVNWDPDERWPKGDDLDS